MAHLLLQRHRSEIHDEASQITKSTCCYCGVGCGLLIETENEQIVNVRGGPEHPANFGRLCTKRAVVSDGKLLGIRLAVAPVSRSPIKLPGAPLGVLQDKLKCGTFCGACLPELK